MLDLAAPWRLSAAGASAAVSRATASAAIVCVGRRMAAARAVVTAIVAPAGTSAARTASATVAGLIVVAPGIAGATRSSQHFLAARTVKAVGTGAVRTRGAAASAVEALLARAIAIQPDLLAQRRGEYRLGVQAHVGRKEIPASDPPDGDHPQPEPRTERALEISNKKLRI